MRTVRPSSACADGEKKRSSTGITMLEHAVRVETRGGDELVALSFAEADDPCSGAPRPPKYPRRTEDARRQMRFRPKLMTTTAGAARVLRAERPASGVKTTSVRPSSYGTVTSRRLQAMRASGCARAFRVRKGSWKSTVDPVLAEIQRAVQRRVRLVALRDPLEQPLPRVRIDEGRLHRRRRALIIACARRS